MLTEQAASAISDAAIIFGSKRAIALVAAHIPAGCIVREMVTFSPNHEAFFPYTPVQILQDLDKYGVIAARGVIDLVTGRRIAIIKEFMKPKLVSGDSCRKIPWKR